MLRHDDIDYIDLDELVQKSTESGDLYTMRVALDYAVDASYEQGHTRNSYRVNRLMTEMLEGTC